MTCFDGHLPASPPHASLAPQSALSELSQHYGLPQPKEAFWTARDGATLRYAHWASDAKTRRGQLLFLNGRTEFIEKAIQSYAVMVNSGLDLWTLDWRGQGLSERFLNDSHKGHITDYQLYLDDLDSFVRDIADLPGRPGKTFMLAHSMGGHIGLRYLHDHPGVIDKAVLLAPMIDISVNRAPLRKLNQIIKMIGFGNAYALGTGRFKPIFINPDDPNDNGTVEHYRALLPRYEGLSRNPRTRAEIERFVRDNKALAIGGPTSAWLDATFHSINLTLAPGYAEAIRTPVLLIGGGRDKTVITAEQEAIADRLPKGAFRLIERGGHELLMECPYIRKEVFDAFSDWTGLTLAMESGQNEQHAVS